MTFEQLRVLNAVIDAGSFKGASELLKRSQPAISVSIKNLEDELGIQLFSRDHYRAVMTEQGLAFYERSKTVVAETETLANFGKYLAKGYEDQIKISIDGLYPFELAVSFIKECRKKYTKTELIIIFDYQDGGMEKLLEDKVDIAITLRSQNNPKLEEIALNQITLLPVVSQIHELSRTKPEYVEKTFKNYVQIVSQNTGNLSANLEYGLIIEGRHWIIPDLTTKKSLIIEGFGWGYLPQYNVVSELENSSLVRLRSQSKTPFSLPVKALRRMEKVPGKVCSEIWKDIKGIACR